MSSNSTDQVNEDMQNLALDDDVGAPVGDGDGAKAQGKPDIKTFGAKKACFNLPFGQGAQLVGREEEMNALRKLFADHRRAALVGKGGAGKSQMAIEYCHLLRAEDPDRHIFWVNAHTVERFEGGFRDIAQTANKLPTWRDPAIINMELVVNWLKDEANGTWFLVLDEIDDPKLLLTPLSTGRASACDPVVDYIPDVAHGCVLMTSRSRLAAKHFTRDVSCILRIEPMAEPSARALLHDLPAEVLSSTYGREEEDDLAVLIETLQGSPLALKLAAAYIRYNAPRVTVAQYVAWFRDEASQVKKKKKAKKNAPAAIDQSQEENANNTNNNNKGPDDVVARQCVLRAWEISFEQIQRERPAAAALLSLLSVLDRHSVSKRLVRGKSVRGPEFRARQDILVDMAMVTVDSEYNTFSLHRVIQHATQRWLHASRTLEEWQERAFMRVQELCPQGVGHTYDNWALWEALYPHIIVVLGYRSTRYKTERGMLSVYTAEYESRRGRFEKAVELCREATGLLQRRKGLGHTDTNHAMSVLADALQRQGKMMEAVKFYLQGVTHRQPETVQDLTIWVTELTQLALSCEDQENHWEALKFRHLLMDMTASTFGATDPVSILMRGNYGDCLCSVGRLVEGEHFHREALRLSHTADSDAGECVNRATVQLLNNLKSQRRWADAMEVAEPHLQRLRDKHSRDHHVVMNITTHVADIKGGLGHLKEGEVMLRELIERSRKIVGERHRDTVSRIKLLGKNLAMQGRPEEAEKQYSKAVQLKEQELGRDHPETLRALMLLANHQNEERKYPESRKNELEALRISQLLFGENNMQALEIKSRLIQVTMMLGLVSEAEAYGREVLAQTIKKRGGNHPQVLDRQIQLGIVLCGRRKFDEAIPLLERAWVHGRDTPNRIVSRKALKNYLALALLETENFDKMHALRLENTRVNIGGRWLQRGEDAVAQVEAAMKEGESLD
ncbi:hypothetical protein ASPZODRAFT_141533 [Penicilliopsis zonata CBS 506.65]|uniref:NB-ARC domain-containing protein n=1 Tax=Penicilliopsis zonata CBS 506.65 TaxID=1073090 RepID=A0A1L9SLL2_9EURO|nr:hypothetical protein ASPZODRAFT_141533 [Penicilliopsis zonata CBS 506.65]OJJ47981.1 hypothetical protein ASPZODRAFT_141533 [Penicilliopsis zonata CBS 506.65]